MRPAPLKIKPCRGSEAVRSEARRRSAPGTAPRPGGPTRARNHARLHRQQTLALHLLARKLTGATDRFRLFPSLLFRRLFVMTAKLHLAENALALHLLLQRLQGLIDVIVANENLHACSFVGGRTG